MLCNIVLQTLFQKMIFFSKEINFFLWDKVLFFQHLNAAWPLPAGLLKTIQGQTATGDRVVDKQLEGTLRRSLKRVQEAVKAFRWWWTAEDHVDPLLDGEGGGILFFCGAWNREEVEAAAILLKCALKGSMETSGLAEDARLSVSHELRNRQAASWNLIFREGPFSIGMELNSVRRPNPISSLLPALVLVYFSFHSRESADFEKGIFPNEVKTIKWWWNTTWSTSLRRPWDLICRFFHFSVAATFSSSSALVFRQPLSTWGGAISQAQYERRCNNTGHRNVNQIGPMSSEGRV